MATVRGFTSAQKKTLHIVSLLIRARNLSGLLTIAISLISAAPLYAQRHQQNVAKLKDDARNAVGIIGGDKATTQRYCQIVDLVRQMNQAVGEKNQKKARALAQEIVQLRKQLPEFVVPENVVKHIDLNSPDGREIALIIQSLNESCPFARQRLAERALGASIREAETVN